MSVRGVTASLEKLSDLARSSVSKIIGQMWFSLYDDIPYSCIFKMKKCQKVLLEHVKAICI